MKVVFADSFFESLDRLKPRFLHDWWYWLKCRLWHRHNVVRIRTLPPTWNDRVDVLPHAMFQVLSDFINLECPYEHFDIENSHHKAEWAEIREHYDWWHNVALKFDAWHDWDSSKATPWENQFAPSDDGLTMTLAEPTEYERTQHAIIWQREADMEAELTRRLIRLVELRGMYWT